MRGRTNVGGGSNNFFVDGKTETGIVGERSGIVSGDFVEKIFTKKELVSSDTYKEYCVSDNFSLGGGRFCTFYLRNNNKGELQIWFYKIDNNEMVDDGTIGMTILNADGSINTSAYAMAAVKISEFEFVIFCSDNKIHYYYKVSIIGGNATILYLGENDTNTYTYVKFASLEKIGINKLIIAYIERSSASNKSILYIIELNENSITFGESYSSNDGVYAGMSVYEDEHIALFQGETVNFLKVNGDAITLSKKYTLPITASSAAYIGENKSVVVARRYDSDTELSIIGYVLTMTEETTSISVQKQITNNIANLGNNPYVRYTNGKLFIVAPIVTTHTVHNPTITYVTTKYHIGMWSEISENPIDLIDTSYSIQYGTGEESYISGICENSGCLVVAPCLTGGWSEPTQLGFGVSEYEIEPLEEILKFKKRVSRIDGVAKQSAAYEQLIEVYVPK